ncbi:MAG: sensor histidine kinase [Chitinophagaceae bacterium]
MSMWVPVFILFSYPMAYIVVPNVLLKGQVWQFMLIILIWAALGLLLNAAFRTYLYAPFQEWLGFQNLPKKGLQANSYLCMTTSAASPMIIKFFKLWTIKQREWMKLHHEKIHTDLELLKARAHPHFIINTLKNIHRFSLGNSAKTPQLILKLSSLLSYMLYDCKATEVRMEKELEMMKYYIDLEHERYMNKMDVSWSVDGNTQDQYIAPLLILPFLENAFTHGISREISKSWLSVDISIKKNSLLFKIANSKDAATTYTKMGMGMKNVITRLRMLYSDRYDLKVHDEGDFFVVSLMIQLPYQEFVHEELIVNNQHAKMNVA